jgi:hypothetical protein
LTPGTPQMLHWKLGMNPRHDVNKPSAEKSTCTFTDRMCEMISSRRPKITIAG